jgi:surface protein
MTVDWGDNSFNAITAYNQAETTHSYASQGVYTVKISGRCRGFRFNNSGDKLKILNIANWGASFRLATPTAAGGNYFQGCAKLTITATDNLDLTAATNLNSMFSGCASLTTAPTMALWDTSQVTIATAMFSGCAAFNQPVGNWNTANVTTMGSMFNGCSAFNQPLDSWDVSKVANMNQMFTKTYAFKQNLGAWAPLALTDASVMFYSSNMNTTGATTLYDALLNGWAAQAVLNNVPFGAGSSKYSAAAADARSHLTATHGWTITDGGLAA